MKLYFIAGEHSGDFIGAKIIKSLKELKNKKDDVSFWGVGGPQIEAQGIKSLFDFNRINLMGFVEVIPHILEIRKLINLTVQDIISKDVDVLVTIDSPGFTLRVAKKIRRLAPKIKLVHVVAPSVWAYKENRAKKYAKIYDKLLTLFPFEVQYFTKYGLDTECIGHPILEQHFEPKLLKSFYITDTKTICVTPGSRKNEIARHMPTIVNSLKQIAVRYKIKVIFVQPNNDNTEEILSYLQNVNFEFECTTDRLNAFSTSDFAIAKSGTNTLEIAASRTPMIIFYKINVMTYFLIKRFIKIKYVNIINIVADREIIPEYIQLNFEEKNITQNIAPFLFDKSVANKQVVDVQPILKSIGFTGDTKPSTLAAKAIYRLAPGMN